MAHVGHEVMNAFSYGTVCRRRVFPKVIGWCGEQLADRSHGIEVKEGVAIRFGPGRLQWKTAVVGHLLRQQYRFITFDTLPNDGVIADVACESCHLHYPASAMVIFGVHLVDTIGM